jgi:hypothetical protein
VYSECIVSVALNTAIADTGAYTIHYTHSLPHSNKKNVYIYFYYTVVPAITLPMYSLGTHYALTISYTVVPADYSPKDQAQRGTKTVAGDPVPGTYPHPLYIHCTYAIQSTLPAR